MKGRCLVWLIFCWMIHFKHLLLRLFAKISIKIYGSLKRWEFSLWVMIIPYLNFLKSNVNRKPIKHGWQEKQTPTLREIKKRWGITVTREDYKKAIHQAVIESKGIDAYTGKKLKWVLIGKYDNDQSKNGGSDYKKKFGELPTGDHVSGKGERIKFKICSWKVNDAKNGLNYKEFVKLCKEVIAFSEE